MTALTSSELSPSMARRSVEAMCVGGDNSMIEQFAVEERACEQSRGYSPVQHRGFHGGHDFIKDSVIDMTERELVNNLGVRVGSGAGALKAAMCAVDDNSMTGFNNGSEEQILQTFAISLAEKHHCGARVSHVSKRFVFGADHRIFSYFTRG